MKKKTGLNSLSSYYKLINHSNISQSSLGGIDWDYYFNNNISPLDPSFPKLDNLAMDHLNTFWDFYN